MSAATGKITSAAETWQQELARAYTRVPDLLRALDLNRQLDRLPAGIVDRFPLKVPRGYVARMRRGDANDPLLRQVLPIADEATPVPGFGPDPVGDLASSRGPGLLQKYHGRALVIATGACAVHCRYCFRREFPYQEQQGVGERAAGLLARLRADETISEVILSGGDPLSLSNAKLNRWLRQLGDIGHLRRLRIHTRLPVVLPERVDNGLLDAFAGYPGRLVVVVHANHAREIDAAVADAMHKLAAGGATLLNQSVLLRGVNDDVDTLTRLSETLFDAGVLPYYLHQLDPVAGAAHFAVSDAKASQLIGQVAAQLPGYLVPRLVRELAGMPAKTALPVGHKPHRPHNQNLVT